MPDSNSGLPQFEGSGCEWVVEAHGCLPDRLRDVAALRALFDRILDEMNLRAVESPAWHQFPETGGVTGLTLLAESHIACHTFPEFGTLCLNVFCCRERPDWDFEACLREAFAASRVCVRRIERRYR